MTSFDPAETAKALFEKRTTGASRLARQVLFNTMPLSKVVETYLFNNEGRPQLLDRVPMHREFYDNLPRNFVLKCSRKTFKSTILSNLLVINAIRYNYYKALYVGPLDNSAKYFSNSYLSERFKSPAIKKICSGLSKDDVYEKVVTDTNSQILVRYASEDATRIRGPIADAIAFDEAQNMNYDIFQIIKEVTSTSPVKRKAFCGTPLTTDNTMNRLWKESSQIEWLTKCEGCGQWNGIYDGVDVIRMVQKQGLCCVKCDKILDTSKGEYVAFAKENSDNSTGIHFAQPMLPYYNQDPNQWDEIYKDVHGGKYTTGQLYQEKFGIAYDEGTKLLTDEELRRVCTLGPMEENGQPLSIFHKGGYRYKSVTAGMDFGVNMQRSRSVLCIGGLTDAGVYEVFYLRVFHDKDYIDQINEAARLVNETKAMLACDSGPDPIRGEMLISQLPPETGFMVRYEHGKTIQRFHVPQGARHWKEHRWVLHRSDVISFAVRSIKNRLVLFPTWPDVKESMEDILGVYMEVRDTGMRSELFYRHPPDIPDDAMHAVTWADTLAHSRTRNPALLGQSSTGVDPEVPGAEY